jgi:ubiquinone/menaquinone biosynthesis C-methylase UbiE
MAVKNDSPYLPKSRFKYLVSAFKTSFAYRVWKRKLDRYGGFRKYTKFKLLEVGCGPGHFLKLAEKWFPNAEIYGLDIDVSLVEFVSEQVKKAKVIRHDGHVLPFHDKTFDIVCALQVIEHLKRPESFFTEASRVLKPEGFLVCSTPNPIGLPALVLKDRWQGYRYDHISLKTPQEWREIIQNAGFNILSDGTTGLTGFKVLQKLPLAVINWIPMAIFGYFPWYKGESYMLLARKITDKK